VLRVYWFTQGKYTHSYADIGHTTVALDEALDILAYFDSDSHSLMARDELRREDEVCVISAKGCEGSRD